jgi:hypothetical protein
MGKVVGALVGLVAAAAYALAAAELLRGETGVDLLAAARAAAPENVLAWIARVPLAGVEGAPMWRPVVMAVAVGSGAVGGLFLIVGARLSAVFLWLAFMLLLGVLVGQDVLLGGSYESLSDPRLVAGGAALGAAFVFAAIANIVTARPREEPDGARDFERAELVRERLRSDPPPRREPPREDRSDAPPRTPRAERRARLEEQEPPSAPLEPEPRRTPEPAADAAPPARDDDAYERPDERDEPTARASSRSDDAETDEARDEAHADRDANERVSEKT